MDTEWGTELLKTPPLEAEDAALGANLGLVATGFI